MWGGQQGREEARQQAEAARIPPCPPDGLPDDPTELQNARTALKQAHRQLVSALNTEVAMRQTLAQCQLDFQRTMRGGADYALRQWHKDNLQMVAGKYQQSQFAAAAARSSYQHALKLFHRTVERCEGLRTGADASASPAASPPSKRRRKPEEPAASAATKSRFDAECEAWDTLLSVDPTKMSIKDLRRCATDVGIDVSTLVEREDYVNALTKKRDTGQAAFNEKKRKRDEERAAVEAKQRAKKASEEEESRQTRSRPSSLHLGHARGPPSVPLPLRREHRPTRSINQAFAPKELPPGDVKVSPRPRATKIDSRAGVGERGHQVAYPRLAAAPTVIAP